MKAKRQIQYIFTEKLEKYQYLLVKKIASWAMCKVKHLMFITVSKLSIVVWYLDVAVGTDALL